MLLENTRLWQAFLLLTPLERKHLGQWLASPFFCRQPHPARLFDYLSDCRANDRLPEQAQAHSMLFGAKTPFRAQALRQAMSDLLAQLEHFLVYREKFENTADFGIYLARAYRKRGQEKHFRQSIRVARTAWAQQPYRHAEYFDAQAAIEYEVYQHLSAGRRTEALNWQDLSDQTDLAFISRKLRQACFALSHQTVFKADYQFGLLEAVLQHVRQNASLQQAPAVGLYFFCYLFLAEPDGELYFREFKRRLFAHLQELPTEEQRNLHLLAINFCIRKINESETRYSHEALELYQSALQARLLLENGQLSHFAFNNIVAIALKVGETAWAEQFIREQAPFLEKRHRDATIQLNLARVAFERKQFGAALLHLQEADYKDLINNLIAKTLQLKIYYESDELDALDAHLQSMDTFIRRQHAIGYHKTNYQKIIRYTRRLTQLPPGDARARTALRRAIEQEPKLTEKEWLLAAVDDIF